MVQGSGVASGRNESTVMAEGVLPSNILSLDLILLQPSVLCATRHQLKLGEGGIARPLSLAVLASQAGSPCPRDNVSRLFLPPPPLTSNSAAFFSASDEVGLGYKHHS